MTTQKLKWPLIFVNDTRAGEVNDWENPEMIGQNKEPAHCTLKPYLD